MLFLFNDQVFEIGQPSEVIESGNFPLSPKSFSRLSELDVLSLVREEIFSNLLLVHNAPARAIQLAVLVAGKTNANAMLAGAPDSGAPTAAHIAVLLAEVSLLTMSSLHSQQAAGNLSPGDVETSVWAALR